ncbi:MAG: HAD hydrolase-like protein [Deltaproteobacteria bacterium]|nr:HAD hydrolase-like protein [Deltaproteobacteria bacterium]
MRAAAVVFDPFGTLFDLEPLRERLLALGLPSRELEVWLARTARDGIALCASGTFKPFQEIASSALLTLIAEQGKRPQHEQVAEVVSGVYALAAFKDAKVALDQLKVANTRRVLLTLEAKEGAQTLLARAGMEGLVEEVESIDQTRRWMPFPEPYRHVALSLGLQPQQIAFVSTAPWDVQGARAAGMYGVLLQRKGGHHQPAMPPPDLTIASLAELAQVAGTIDP